MALIIQHQQAAGLRRRRCAIRRGQASHNHPTRPQNRERGRQADSSRAISGQSRGANLRKNFYRTVGGDIYDCCSRALKIRAGIEITNQDVIADKLAGTAGNDGYSVRINVAVCWNRGWAWSDSERSDERLTTGIGQNGSECQEGA